MSNNNSSQFTSKQGQYLAFIYYIFCTKINGVPPAEMDMGRYFCMTSSSLHSMISTLKKKGLVNSIAGKSRRIKIQSSKEQLPYLE